MMKRFFLFGAYRFLRSARGATAIEYGLIAALIAMSIVLALRGFSDSNNSLFAEWSEAVNTASSQ